MTGPWFLYDRSFNWAAALLRLLNSSESETSDSSIYSFGLTRFEEKRSLSDLDVLWTPSCEALVRGFEF